ncbi:MAG: DUF5916 domain-containing protein [Gemmatimonadales bacterium]
MPRATSDIDLDGKIDEAAWHAIAPLPLVQYTPTEGAPPSDSSTIRLSYDDKYLYASARMFVDGPGTIRPGLFVRDQLGSEDHFMLILDSSSDDRSGLVFAINPAGGLTDYAVGGDGQALDVNWNGYWDGVSTKDQTSWSAELRIPLSTLRFQPGPDGVVMGVIIHRRTSSRSEFATFPQLSSSYSNALFRVSIAQKIGLTGIRARSPAYLTPYLLGGVNSVAAFDDRAVVWGRSTSQSREIGLDAKVGLTGNLTLDLTANTDFAQVEADNQQVNLSRFSLFFPEKRQFFLERGDIFQVGTEDFGPSRLFHSRRIGLAPDGSPLRIHGGARVVGRIGSLDVGALSMQTATEGGNGSENNAVIRVRRTLARGSYLGAMVTSRLPTAGGHNVVYATDAILRPFGNDYLTALWAQSFDDRHPNAGTSAGLARLNWARRSQRGLVYSLSATWQGADFEPGLGFLQRRDVATGFANVRYGWFPGARTAIQNITPSLLLTAARRNATGLDESRAANFYLNFAFKSGVAGHLVVSRGYESLDRDLRLGAAAVVAGNYQFDQIGGYVATSNRARLAASFNTTMGEFYDGTITTIGVSPSWSPSAHFQATVDLLFNRIEFARRNQRFDADQLRVRASYAHDSRLSLAAFLQYSRSADAVGANVRARYHFAEGRDLWLVYNDLLDTERLPALGVPRSPLSLSRTVMVKYIHTLTR